MQNNQDYNGNDPAQEAGVPLTEEYETWLLLGQVADGMLRARDNELRSFGVSSIQIGVIYAVKNMGGTPTASEISRMLVRRPATVYKLLDRMERQGLVQCLRNTEGKPEVRVQLTEKGKDVYRHHDRQVIPRILGSLPAQERRQLKATLEKLRTKTFEELTQIPSFP